MAAGKDAVGKEADSEKTSAVLEGRYKRAGATTIRVS